MVKQEDVFGQESPSDAAFERALMKLRAAAPTEAEVAQAVGHFRERTVGLSGASQTSRLPMSPRLLALAASLSMVMMGMVASSSVWAEVVREFSDPLQEPQAISTLQPGTTDAEAAIDPGDSPLVAWPIKLVLLVHVVSLLIGLGAMFLSWCCTVTGWGWVHLRNGNAIAKPSGFSARAGRFSRLLLACGLVCYAVGIFFGCLWSQNSWGRFWSWDPREAFSLLTVAWGGVWLRAIARDQEGSKPLQVSSTQSASVATVALGMTLNMVILGGMYAQRLHAYGNVTSLPNLITGAVVVMLVGLWGVHRFRMLQGGKPGIAQAS